MSLVDLVMPKLGESIMEATILKWHKKTGDRVTLDESILDIATDKVDSEVPSTTEGIIEEILFKENDVVPIGTVIARIKSGDPFTGDKVNGGFNTASSQKTASENSNRVEDIPFEPADLKSRSTSTIRFYSPLVLNIAASEGVSMMELERIIGTGQDGRVSKKDMIQFIENRKRGVGSQTVVTDHSEEIDIPAKGDQQDLPVVFTGNVEVFEMDRMRKLIARHMIDSQNISAHVTSFAECDVTNMVLWRERNKMEFEKREGEKITFTPLFVEAIVKCIKKHPWLNSSVEGDRIIVKKDINIGMATATPSGNLIVPVIRHADQLNLVGLTKQVNGLATAARNNKLKPDDTSGGTFTLTNVGTFGSIMGTPIINQPQVAIMAVGVIKKRPVVIETAQGDSIAIRHMMYISLSYDHRIIDGALGSTFLNAVSKELENFDAYRSF